MTIDRLFFGYMALAGAAAGLILVVARGSQDFFIKPYFWILIAVGLFEFGAYLRGQNAPGTMLTMNARLIGFGIGVVLMVVIPMLAGTPVRFF